ncbi:hypothetical protein [Luteitalea sp.]
MARERSRSAPTTGSTLYDLVRDGLSVIANHPRLVAGVAVGVALVVAALWAAGLLSVSKTPYGITLNWGTALERNASGEWSGKVTDLGIGEFRAAYEHRLRLRISQSGDVTGSVTTLDADTKDEVGAPGVLSGQAEATDGLLRVNYTLTTGTALGFGNFAATLSGDGKSLNGYALYRRTRAANGTFGLGRLSLTRPGPSPTATE